MRTDEPTRCAAASDEWSEWLTRRRDGGDATLANATDTAVAAYVARLLDGARLKAGLTLADIGCGLGAVGLAALARDPSLHIVYTDVSARLLELTEAAMQRAGHHARGRYLACAADALTELEDASVDVVACRAVLAYVDDKPAALREFYRVLRPGGRLSMAEPVLRDDALAAAALDAVAGARAGAPGEAFLGLLARWRRAQFPVTPAAIAASPLTNYSERDLLQFVRAAGFAEAHLELHIDVRLQPPSPWQTYLGTALHPWAPTLGEILDAHYAPDERLAFEAMLRPLVEAGRMELIERVAYLQGIKPPGG